MIMLEAGFTDIVSMSAGMVSMYAYIEENSTNCGNLEWNLNLKLIFSYIFRKKKGKKSD